MSETALKPMKNVIMVAAACAVAFCAVCCGQNKPVSDRYPEHVIFETDLGNDIDDAMALDMLYSASTSPVQLQPCMRTS